MALAKPYPSMPVQQVKHIQFSVLSPDEIVRFYRRFVFLFSSFSALDTSSPAHVSKLRSLDCRNLHTAMVTSVNEGMEALFLAPSPFCCDFALGLH